MLCLYYFLKLSFMSTLSSRGAAWDLRKRIYPRRVFGQLSHKFPPASAKLYQVWSKIISTKPNVHSRTVLRALSFLSKSLQFTTFFLSANLKQFWNKALHSRLKKTNKKISVLSYNILGTPSPCGPIPGQQFVIRGSCHSWGTVNSHHVVVVIL